MKKILVVALLAFALNVRAQQSGTVPVHVEVNSEAKDLADGYARASAKLTRPPITLALQKEGVLRIIEDVRSVQSAQGVIIIEVGKGLIYVINPKDVVYITDGSKIPVAKTDATK